MNLRNGHLTPTLLLGLLAPLPAVHALEDPFTSRGPWTGITVRAAAAPVPALAIELLPPFTDETGGNAAVAYLKAAIELPPRDDILRAIDWLALEPSALAAAGATIDAPELGGPRLFTLMQAGARCRHCDWQTDLVSPEVLPELQKIRSAAQLLNVRARLQAGSGDAAGALETIAVGFAVAEDLAEGPTVLQAIVGCAIGSMFVDTCQAVGAQPGAPNLYWALTHLPTPLVDVRRALRSERAVLDELVPQLVEIRAGRVPDEAWTVLALEIVRSVSGATGRDLSIEDRLHITAWALAAYPGARARLIERGHAAAAVDAMPTMQVVLTDAVHAYDVARDDVYKWLALPYAEARAPVVGLQTGALSAPMRPGAPFLDLLPALDRILASEAALERRIAAQRCVEALRLHAAEHGSLPASLDDVRAVPIPIDPMSGEAFAYRRTAEDAAELVAPPIDGEAIAHALRFRLQLRP